MTPQDLWLPLDTLREKNSAKWRVYPADVLPAWIADMDYALAPPVRAALETKLGHDDLGYPQMYGPSGLAELFCTRAAQRYGWTVDPARLEFTSDVVQAIYLCLLTLTRPGDGILIQTPIYPPFLHAVRETGRRLVECPLIWRDGVAGFDRESLEASVDAGTRVLLLCHPHNPSGRAFRREELELLADFVRRHDLLVISDEIHADLMLDPRPHVPFAALAPDLAERTVTLTSASKAFNIAGLCLALAVFGTSALQQRFHDLPSHVRGGRSALGMVATAAAWRDGDDWLETVRAQLRVNRERVADFLAGRWPQLRLAPPEATYLAWIDCRALGLDEEPWRFFLREARVALSEGPSFGAPGAGWVRLNFATSPVILDEILSRLDRALVTAGKPSAIPPR